MSLVDKTFIQKLCVRMVRAEREKNALLAQQQRASLDEECREKDGKFEGEDKSNLPKTNYHYATA